MCSGTAGDDSGIDGVAVAEPAVEACRVRCRRCGCSESPKVEVVRVKVSGLLHRELESEDIEGHDS